MKLVTLLKEFMSSEAEISAGLLMYKLKNNRLEVFLVHPGGPYWAGKDAGSWSIPKGHVETMENFKNAAIREFQEETGITVPQGAEIFQIGTVILPSKKVVHGFAFKTDEDLMFKGSNPFEIEWPRNSGKKMMVPENDKGEWFKIRDAYSKINKGQYALLQALERKVAIPAKNTVTA